MKRGVAVHFACNDPDNGDFAGKAGMAAVSIGEHLMDLELDFLAGVKFTELDGAIRIHRRVFKVISTTYWCGNWCWNAYRLPRREYRRLIRTLAEHGWRCTSGLVRWGEAYDALAAGRAALKDTTHAE
jgi:hypothetical protein